LPSIDQAETPYNENYSENGRGNLDNSLFNLHLIINYFIKTLPRRLPD